MHISLCVIIALSAFDDLKGLKLDLVSAIEGSTGPDALILNRVFKQNPGLCLSSFLDPLFLVHTLRKHAMHSMSHSVGSLCLLSVSPVLSVCSLFHRLIRLLSEYLFCSVTCADSGSCLHGASDNPMADHLFCKTQGR